MALIAGIVAGAIYLFVPSSIPSSSQQINAIAARGPGAAIADLQDAKPADIPAAMLGQFYEHVIEHTPPRDQSGSMQKRERFYHAPPDPFVILETKLNKGSTDQMLLEKVQLWRQRWMEGAWVEKPPVGQIVQHHGPRTPGQRYVQSELPQFGLPSTRFSRPAHDGKWDMSEVQKLASQSSLDALTLLEIGRAFDFLMGDEAAGNWYRAAFIKAQKEFANTPAGNPSVADFLHTLDQTTALWRIGDNAALEQRFALAMTLNAPLSIPARRAGALHATALFYAGRYQDAADAIMKVWGQHKQVNDLNALDQSDLGELNWVTALYLVAARHDDQAVPYYEAFLKTNDNRKLQGAYALAACLTRLGRTSAAEQIRKQYHLSPPPTTRVIRYTTRPSTQPVAH